MPLVPLTDTVLAGWAEMLQVEAAWTPPGYWSITVTVSSHLGKAQDEEQAGLTSCLNASLVAHW